MKFSGSTAVVVAIPVALAFFFIGQATRGGPAPNDGNPVGMHMQATNLKVLSHTFASLPCVAANTCSMVIDLQMPSPGSGSPPSPAACATSNVVCYTFNSSVQVSSVDYAGVPHPEASYSPQALSASGTVTLSP
jgi:hypothetical protein